ncbi:MAG: radical SAM family heme chaperone HemW [Acidobacteriaceae bacterium]|nr:radical SAM family heme chaperone HemW [Acidobacteriaceae bacterium]MBV9501610.1 radical SAM family heme chaperone HemW [Acidobacteriaceae bacterium]
MPGVYISYPFCAQKCTFCNFASDVYSSELQKQYEKALLDEVRSHSWDWPPETVYFGGGTPSLMRVELLRELISAIPGRDLREVTLECAPGSLTGESIEGWKTCGVNRVSLGVQSFVTEELQKVGRRHTAETVRNEIAILREAGIRNINIDLIAGLPGQTAASWNESLQWIARLDPPHVSVYIFEVDEDSRLGREILFNGVRYGATRVPSDDLTGELYETAVARLSQFGIDRYEISNFARPGFESLHNLKYWKLEPYVGFGLDAHSFNGRERWSDPDDLREYLDLGRKPGQRTRTNAGEEHFFVGLRLMSGIQPTAEEWTRFREPIEKWIGLGMLEREGGRLALAPGAVLLSNEIFREFLDA